MDLIKFLKSLKSNLPLEVRNSENPLDDYILDLRKIFMKREIKQIFDIGAHEGNISKRLSKEFKDATIYAFEPFPDSFDKLSSCTITNHSIKAYPIALSSSNGNEQLFVNQFSETNSLLPSRKLNSVIDKFTSNVDSITVKTATLDSFCLNHSIEFIDFIKLDTQGSELRVLEGGKELLRTQAIAALYCEVEFVEIYENQPLFFEVFEYLKNYNYSLYKFYNFNFLETGQLAWADALFISNELFLSFTS